MGSSSDSLGNQGCVVMIAIIGLIFTVVTQSISTGILVIVLGIVFFVLFRVFGDDTRK